MWGKQAAVSLQLAAGRHPLCEMNPPDPGGLDNGGCLLPFHQLFLRGRLLLLLHCPLFVFLECSNVHAAEALGAAAERHAHGATPVAECNGQCRHQESDFLVLSTG